jgi:hypothetical protein
MKTTMKQKGAWLIAGILFLGTALVSAHANKEEVADTINYKTYFGKVIDQETGRVLPFATVEAVESNVATVTNIDGNFTIKIAKGSDVSKLKVSYIGYKNKTEDLEKYIGDMTMTITLEPSSIQLKEVTVRPWDGLELIMNILASTRLNYSQNPMMMRGFYRETIQRGRNYVSISEAVIDIFKSAYVNDFQVDQIKLFKGRKSADVEKMDTVLFKVQGGPNTTILLDVMKNPYILLTDDCKKIYDFSISDVVSIDDRLHYVISFDQKSYIDEPYYNGRLFIDIEKLAITEAEFELNTENKEEAARLLSSVNPWG